MRFNPQFIQLWPQKPYNLDKLTIEFSLTFFLLYIPFVKKRLKLARIRNFYKEERRGHFLQSYNAILISFYIPKGEEDKIE